MSDAETFLQESEQFRLGELPTEAQHPKTSALSRLATEDVPAAIRVLREVDVEAVERVLPAVGRLEKLRDQIADTILTGGRVFLCGCGATGRLSISLEVLWRHVAQIAMFENSVVGFMAGGDLALVHSIENFEDHPAYGARQLLELGFGENDLLIATTEGGETPFVIGATEQAATSSRRSPWFLYCNPDEALQGIERSARVLRNPTIEKVSLFVGPMALSGSTRMQASTVLQLSVGLALLGWSQSTPLRDEINAFLHILRAADMSFLEQLVREESRVYEDGGFVLYEAGEHGITILTDTTERSPTFSLLPFENVQDSVRTPALCYFHVPNTASSLQAWRALLRREPRTLEWEEVAAVAGRERLLGFDFSDQGADLRAARVPTFQEVFAVHKPGQSVEFNLSLRGRSPVMGRFSFAALPSLFEHLLLKIALNIHSTLVMGRLGRYEANLMTHVRPSNKKLVDRTVRYVLHLLRASGVNGVTYPDVARAVFAEMEESAADEPIVLRVVERLRRK